MTRNHPAGMLFGSLTMTMGAKEFVDGIREEVVTRNMRTYRRLFAQTRPSDASDAYWQSALQLFGELDRARQDILLGIVRQTMVDTVSSLLAVLDGVSDLPGQNGSIEVRIADENLAGNLQDLFLSAEEAAGDHQLPENGS